MNEAHVTVLGSNSAVAVHDRFPSGQVFSSGNNHILIDCGEGTQFRMDQYGVKRSKISTILITHLHGDHVFGLPGLLTSYQLSGRRSKLSVFGPKPIKKYLDVNLGEIGHFISFPLEIIELDEDLEKDKLHTIFENNGIKIEAFFLYHRIACFGYKISEKQKRPKIQKDFIEKYKPTVPEIQSILAGEPFYDKANNVIPVDKILIPAELPKSYAYCSDTIYHPPLSQVLENTSCIYHESTYLHDMEKQAKERFHTTAKEAGIIAQGAFAQKLILGHFSSRYYKLEEFKEEASEEFQGEIFIAKEGETFTI